MSRKLTPKQEKFINEFVISNNATESAIKAGYAKNSARQIATENLSKPYIAEAVKVRRDEIQEMADFKAQDVLKGFSELATLSVVDLLTKDGELDLTAIKNAGLGRFIQEFTVTEIPTKDGVKTQTKVKGYSRMDALKSLADIYGMKTEARQNPDNIPESEQALKLANKLYKDTLARAKDEYQIDTTEPEHIEQARESTAAEVKTAYPAFDKGEWYRANEWSN